MTTLFVRHEVEDFQVWKAAYDAFDAERKTMGVTGDGVYQAIDDRNDVTVYHDFDSADAATTFASSRRLKEVMGEAGVIGTPSIWFANRV